MKKLISVFISLAFTCLCACSSVNKIETPIKSKSTNDGMVTIIVKGKVEKMTYENWKILSEFYLKKQ